MSSSDAKRNFLKIRRSMSMACMDYRCQRTGDKGDCPSETVYVLPTTTKPEILELFKTDDPSGGGIRLSYAVNGLDASALK